MTGFSKVYRWLEAGKQVGKTCSYTKDNKVYYASVAVQKWNAIYKLYFDEIEESHMAEHENYLLEEVIEVEDFEQLSLLIRQKTAVQLNELIPLKGQRIFNPSFS